MSSQTQVWPPVLLAERPRALQIALPIVGPVLLGVFCGWLLGESKAGYLIVTTLGILGGLHAGYEHNTTRGGALRGVSGGVLFALAIAETWRLIGADAKADVPHPIELLVLIFGAISTVLGIVGAALRRRNAARAAAGSSGSTG
jgi:hypothetical protein